MKAEILSIGTEILMGEITDTNASFIASRLPALGIQLNWVSQVGDSLDMLVEAFQRGLGRSDIVLTTGGLGPTQDDLTREAIARIVGEEMAVEDNLLKELESFFKNRGIDMPPTNIKQATLIPSARTIPNTRGTAPGWWVAKNGKVIVAMPGPPSEMQGIWEDEVVPILRQQARGEVILSRTIKTTGLSEGGVDEMVAEYLGKENPYLGIYAKADGIHLRVISRAPDEDRARGLLEPVERGLVSIVGPYIWGYDDQTPEETIGELLVNSKLSLATMESCTGGRLASSITDVPASESYFRGGTVVYSTGSAIANGVPESVIETHGLVSREASEAMAGAARERLQADIGIGLTGIAGPEGVEGKPVGTVHISIALPPSSNPSVHHFPSNWPPRRPVVIGRATSTALIELRRLLNTL